MNIDRKGVGCNCWVRYGDGGWLPAIRKGRKFTCPNGISITKPDQFRDATAEEVEAEMKERNMGIIKRSGKKF